MSVTIAMPRMSTDPELTTAQSKYVESLARAGAEVHWVELSDPDAAAAEALTCDGLLLPGGGDMDPAFYGQERLPACGEEGWTSMCWPRVRRSRCWASAGAFR